MLLNLLLPSVRKIQDLLLAGRKPSNCNSHILASLTILRNVCVACSTHCINYTILLDISGVYSEPGNRLSTLSCSELQPLYNAIIFLVIQNILATRYLIQKNK